jgi:hypothetical protein
MLNSPEDIDAAIERLKRKRPIDDASLEADMRTAFLEQRDEGMTKDYLEKPVPTPRLGA